MNKSEAKELLPLIKAWSEGKTLQKRDCNGAWRDFIEECILFCDPVSEYRIKPEPREFWICQDKGTGYNKSVYTQHVETHDERREVIHVREVLND